MAYHKAANKTKERLTDHAIKLFARRGYDAVTVDEIVKAAKLTKGAFYHHWPSKDDCLSEIHLSFVDYAHGRFAAIMEQSTDPEELIRALMGELFEQIRDHRNRVVVLWDTRRSLPKAKSALVESKKDDIRHFFAQAIEMGQKQKIFDSSHDPRVAAQGIFGMCMWAYQWYDPKGPKTHKEIADGFADLVLAGLHHAPDRRTSEAR